MASESLAFHLLCDKQHMRACAELRVSQGLELVRCCRQEEKKKKAAATTTTVTSTTTTATVRRREKEDLRAEELEEEEQFRSEVEDFVLELVDLSWELLRMASREQLLGTHFMRRPVDEYCAGAGEGEMMEEGAGSEAWPFVKMIDLEACSEAIDGVLGQLMEFLNSAEREEEERKYGSQSSDDEGDSDQDKEEDEDEEEEELNQDSQREGEEAEESKRRQQKLLEAALCERRCTPDRRPHRALRVTCREASPR